MNTKWQQMLEPNGGWHGPSYRDNALPLDFIDAFVKGTFLLPSEAVLIPYIQSWLQAAAKHAL